MERENSRKQEGKARNEGEKERENRGSEGGWLEGLCETIL